MHLLSTSLARVYPLYRGKGSLGSKKFAAPHTHATWLLDQGVSLRVVQTMLGHGSIAVTLDIYSHVSVKLAAQVAVRLNAAVIDTS
jgi:integrase